MKIKRKIKSVNVELTTVCNAKCSLCIRNRYRKIIPKCYLDLDKFKSLDWENTDIEKFVLCGGFGDPILYPNLFRLIDFIHNMNKKFVLFTNGEPHNKKWWEKFALLCNKNDEVMFGIDGLDPEIHVKYRGTSFDKVVENLKTFIEFEGPGNMQFIVFEHNEHQLFELKAFKKELGLKKNIRVIKSRIYSDVMRKPKHKTVNFLDKKNPEFCFIFQNEPAIDTDAKIHICCHSYNSYFLGENIIEPYNTFEELKKSTYWNFDIIKMPEGLTNKLCNNCDRKSW